jgi:hypothetical protein
MVIKNLIMRIFIRKIPPASLCQREELPLFGRGEGRFSYVRINSI